MLLSVYLVYSLNPGCMYDDFLIKICSQISFSALNIPLSSIQTFCSIPSGFSARSPTATFPRDRRYTYGNDVVTLIKEEIKRRLWELPDKHTSYGALINIIASLLRWCGIKAVNLGLLFLSSWMEHFPGHKRQKPVMNEAAVALRCRCYSQISSFRRQ